MTQTETPAALATGAAVIPGVGSGSRVEQAITATLGLSMTSDHQYSFSGIGPFRSVTTFLDIIHKQALYEWSKRIVAEIAVGQYDQLGQMIREHGADAAISWLKGLPGYQRDAAAKLGTSVHLLANMLGASESAVAGFQIAEGTQPYLDAFRGFLGRYGASNIISSEKAVISFSEAYAGTYDMLLKLNGELWLVDIKTSKGLYPETGLQLAAYGHAEYIILPNDPVRYPMPHVDRYGVLHLRPDAYEIGYRFVEYQVRDTDYRAFLAARDLWFWRKEGRFKDTETVPTPVDSTL